ncbi:MAG: tryptophan 7-halogenase [Acidobacteria bacterium]|nr:tryptophan 7-halogenase [Acidobacteriota bacterium]
MQVVWPQHTGHNARVVREVFDAVVIGGGPAGAAAARLLSLWGHSVRLVTRAADPSRSLGESLPPSCERLFDLLGVTQAINAAGFLRCTGNTVWWGEEATRTAAFASGTAGWQVERREFDALLLRLAGSAGAEIVADASVRDVRLAAASGRPGPSVSTVDYVTRDQQRHTVATAFVLDCSGRAGVVARRGYRVADPAGATLALAATWTRDDGWGLPDPSHTLVETYADGWAWSVPVTPSHRYVTVMVDPRTTDIGGDRALLSRYERELAKTVALRGLLRDATRANAPRGCDASLYHAHAGGGPGLLLVGDAASFIDPLSSYGVKKALASAWLAAVVVHTSLTNASLAGVALDLFTAREQEMHEASVTQASTFFAEAAERHLHPFWTGRAGVAEVVDDRGPSADLDVALLRDDPGVLAAFDGLRRAPRISLRRGDEVRMEAKPALREREVVLEERLVLPTWPLNGRGIRFLRDVDLVRLVALAPDHEQVGDLFEAYIRCCPPVSLPDFLGALSVLVAKGALVNETGGL